MNNYKASTCVTKHTGQEIACCRHLLSLRGSLSDQTSLSSLTNRASATVGEWGACLRVKIKRVPKTSINQDNQYFIAIFFKIKVNEKAMMIKT